MISSKDFLKHVCVGQPTKYSKETHIPLLFDRFKDGKDIAAFCSEALITKTTFHDWVNRHNEFKFAYKLALTFAETKWAQYPENNPDFNYPYWSLIMRNRFGCGKSTFKVGNIENPIDMYEPIQQALDNNEITVTEAKQMGDFAQGKLNVINNSLEKGEAGQSSMSPEEQYERVKAYNRMLDSMEGIQKAKEELCK